MSAEKLPEGWVECELSALGNIVTGKTPSTKEPSNFGGNIPFIKPGDLDLGGYIMNTADTLTGKGLSLVPTLPANSVVVTCIGNLGKVGITAKKSASNQQINALIPSEKLNVKFVYYQILTLKPWLESQSAATTIAIVNKSKFSQAPFKFLPLAEQKIIAEKLDTLLAQVESTKARLEQIPQILNRFRQAVLSDAVSGKLTEEWRKKNGLSLPKIITIDEIVESSFYGPRFSKNDYTLESNGIPTIRTTDMEKGNIFITQSTPRVHVPTDKIEQFKVQKNDLLITRTGSIGVMALFTDDYLAIPSAYLIRFRFIKEVNAKYVYFSLTSPIGQQQMGLSTTAITQPNINAKSIRNINIFFPELVEQAEIVRRVEQLFAYADTIEKQVNNALARVNNLTQSILAKAFRGELTAQWRAENPELISGENSAAALLEKIKAERAASGGKKASRKKT